MFSFDDPAFLGSLSIYDPNALAYIRAVEIADGQELEPSVRAAINDFVIGCKADATWSAIKACCLLAGARTLSGALVPLVGPTPTNFNFVSSDYNRKTGLVGDGATKYLGSNRNNNADPQDSNHNAAFVSVAHSGASIGQYIGSGSISTGRNNLAQNGVEQLFTRNRSSIVQLVSGVFVGFAGHSRSQSSEFASRANGQNFTAVATSTTPENANVDIFRRGTANYCDGRIAYYSIGEALDLALLDARVTTLINAINAALP